ncbi:MAG: polyprenyl synthetase family protein [Spirochaetia bacterium]
MKSYFAEKKERIIRTLDSFSKEKQEQFNQINKFAGESAEMLYRYAKSGKMIRGGLVYLGNELFGGKEAEASDAAALAMEFFQAAFLIHDDIMDRDEVRRGMPSMHMQFAVRGDDWRIFDTSQFGQSMAICQGDIAFFLGFELLEAVKSPNAGQICSFAAKEIGYVGFAQMQDVLYSSGSLLPEKREVLRLYTYKTGRYTFSVPLTVGAILAGAEKSQIDSISRLGELLGVLFQITDDELGLFGDEQELGKPIGSDIIERKKTIFYISLIEELSGEDREAVKNVYAKDRVTEDDVRLVMDYMRSAGLKEKVDEYKQELYRKSMKIIDALDGTSEHHKEILIQLLDYNMKRKM